MDWVTRTLWIAIAVFCLLNVVSLIRVSFSRELTKRQKLLFASIVLVPSLLLLYESVLGLLLPDTLQTIITEGIPRPALLTIGLSLLLFVGLPLALCSREYAALAEILNFHKRRWNILWWKKPEPKPWGYLFVGIVVTLIALDIVLESLLTS